MILPLLLDMDQQDYLLQRLLHRLDMGLVLDMEHLGMLLDLLSLLLDMLILLDNLLNLPSISTIQWSLVTVGLRVRFSLQISYKRSAIDSSNSVTEEL